MVKHHRCSSIIHHHLCRFPLGKKSGGWCGNSKDMERKNIKQVRREVLTKFKNEVDTVTAALKPLGYEFDDFKVTACARKAMEEVPGGEFAYSSTKSLLVMFGRMSK